VDATRPSDELSDEYVRWKIVVPKMAQATAVHRKIKTMAAILLIIEVLLGTDAWLVCGNVNGSNMFLF
jgi:hypothetical protein